MSSNRRLADPEAATVLLGHVAREVGRRALRIARALNRAGAKPEARLLSTLLDIDGAFADPRALHDLRGFVHSAELAITLKRLARAAQARPTLTRRAALFAEIARTPHLIHCAPRQRADDGFVTRAAAVAESSWATTRSEVAPLAALLLQRHQRLPRYQVGFPLHAPRDPERAWRAGELGLGGTDHLLHIERARDPRMVLDRAGVTVTQRGAAPQFLTLARTRRSAAGVATSPRTVIADSDGLVLTRSLIATARGLRSGPEVEGLTRRLGRSLARLRGVWPEAWREVHLFTRAVVPLRESGTVSFSTRARPGYSYINVWGKSSLELTDDLVHEASHHKLHALEEVTDLVDDEGDPEWWSPWREAWRPLRGILHACFTFTYGALLFARLLGASDARLTRSEAIFCRRRVLEEHVQLGFSLADLDRAAREGRLTSSGDAIRRRLREEFRSEIAASARAIRAEPGASPMVSELDALRRQLRRRRSGSLSSVCDSV